MRLHVSYLCAALFDVESGKIAKQIRRRVIFTAQSPHGASLSMTNSKPFTGGLFFFRAVTLPQGRWTLGLQSPATDKEQKEGVAPPLEYSVTLQVGPPIEEPVVTTDSEGNEVDQESTKKEPENVNSRKRRMVSYRVLHVFGGFSVMRFAPSSRSSATSAMRSCICFFWM